MTLTLYVDGGVITRNPSPFGGTWAFIIMDHIGKVYQAGAGAFRPAHFELDVVTNNQTEMYAMLCGLQAVPSNCDKLAICSDSMVTIGRVSLGWKWTNIPIDFRVQYQAIIQSLPMWRKDFKFTLLDGHPTTQQLLTGLGKRGNPVSKYNVWCDRKCREAGEILMRQSADSYRSFSGDYPHEPE